MPGFSKVKMNELTCGLLTLVQNWVINAINLITFDPLKYFQINYE